MTRAASNTGAALMLVASIAACRTEPAPTAAAKAAPAQPAATAVAAPAPAPAKADGKIVPELTEEDLRLIAADPAALSVEDRRKRAYALRRKIMQNPDSPTAQMLEDLRRAAESGELKPTVPGGTAHFETRTANGSPPAGSPPAGSPPAGSPPAGSPKPVDGEDTKAP